MREKIIEASIKFSSRDVSITTRTSGASITLRSGLLAGEPGEPALPFRKCFLSVPFDTERVEISFRERKRIHLADSLLIEPEQPNMPVHGELKTGHAEPDQGIYSSDQEWPPNPVRFIAIRCQGWLRIAEALVCPLRYRPASRVLDLVGEIELVVTCRLRGDVRVNAPSLQQLHYERRSAERTRKLVVNPGDVDAHLRFDHNILPRESTAFPEVKHAIITVAALAGSFQRLADWRSLLGLPSRVVMIEEILAGSVPDTASATYFRTAGYSDGGTRDTAEAIRNFVKWAAVNWATEYVVLGGDATLIPPRKAIGTVSSTVTYGDLTFPSYSHKYTPTASTELPLAPVTNVVDDRVGSTWSSEVNDPNPWLRLDLLSLHPINSLLLTWGHLHASAYFVEVSSDGVNWTTAYSTSTGAGGIEEIPLEPCTARYVRLCITSGTPFALATVKIKGPSRYEAGTADGSLFPNAYKIDLSTTRFYLLPNSPPKIYPNPSNSQDGDLVLGGIGGRHEGEVIPYDTLTTGATPGWRFVDALIGPASTVAGRSDYLEIKGPPDWHGDSFLLKLHDNSIPTDLYFGDTAAAEYPDGIHHDWDANGNNVYGERYGGQVDMVNGIADVRVGRLPFTTSLEVDAFVDKLLRYERYICRDKSGNDVTLPPSYAVSAKLIALNWSNYPGSLDKAAQGKEDLRHLLLNEPGPWSFVRLYQDYADVAADDVGPDLAPATKTSIIAAISDGSNIVSLSSHGGPLGLCDIFISDVEVLTNSPGIWYGLACDTNQFDYANGPCFGEHVLRNPDGAGVAYVGYSRDGFTKDNPLELAFWQEMLTSGLLGEMINAAHLMASDWSKYSLNLLGDPAMRVFSQPPRVLTVDHPPKICGDFPGLLTVRVMSAGSPVAGATVNLWVPGVLSVTRETNVAGYAKIGVRASAPATMRIAVSGKNLIPYVGALDVTKCSPVHRIYLRIMSLLSNFRQRRDQ